MALHGNAEHTAQVDGLGIGHAELLGQFVYSDVLRHAACQPFAFTFGLGRLPARPSLAPDSSLRAREFAAERCELLRPHSGAGLPCPFEAAATHRRLETLDAAQPRSAAAAAATLRDRSAAIDVRPVRVEDAADQFGLRAPGPAADARADRTGRIIRQRSSPAAPVSVSASMSVPVAAGVVRSADPSLSSAGSSPLGGIVRRLRSVGRLGRASVGSASAGLAGPLGLAHDRTVGGVPLHLAGLGVGDPLALGVLDVVVG